MLLSAILGDAINLGLTKMAESSGPDLQAVLAASLAHPRRNLFGALAELVNHQYRRLCRPLGDGTTSSSDGQRFRARWPATEHRHVNPKYGSSRTASRPISPTSTRRSAPAW
ncbi:Tn3 family transposase [Klebsiella pneumoniae]|uniref:Tn3 family transposase n=1 Tax=Klebsiella pneumoniae TaxID=573 RepID=UPI003976E4F2